MDNLKETNNDLDEGFIDNDDDECIAHKGSEINIGNEIDQVEENIILLPSYITLIKREEEALNREDKIVIKKKPYLDLAKNIRDVYNKRKNRKRNRVRNGML